MMRKVTAKLSNLNFCQGTSLTKLALPPHFQGRGIRLPCCCAWAFSSCGERWLSLCCGAQASRSSGFSCCASWTLELEFSSCGTGAELSHSMWDLPGSGIEPMSLWQVDSSPVNHQGSPFPLIKKRIPKELQNIPMIVQTLLVNTQGAPLMAMCSFLSNLEL